ncbi:MAG: type II secretion system protein GspE [Gammaproteobacteria bacterium]|nr:type II secretion system protein GspE [Gammaproteobacteria bacterium]
MRLRLSELDENSHPDFGPDASQANGSALAKVHALPFGFARRFGVLVQRNDDATVVVHKNPLELSVMAEVQRFLGMPTQFQGVSDDQFDMLLSDAYADVNSDTRQLVEDLGEEIDLASLADAMPDESDLLEQEGDAPVIRLINALIAEALRENASDIHIETFETSVRVRFRIDGVLREVGTPKRALAPLIVSRIKVMASLDIAERRIPQDGRTTVRIGGRELDVRVSVMPTGSGERVVLRLLDKQSHRLTLPALGMDATTLSGVRDIMQAPHGIFLVTGPTGSGKTTTLYASLAELNTDLLNVLTVEDPIEYNLHGIGQTQVNTKTGMTFATGLRAMLRQDPDIVMVGEIRDFETAEIAIRASLTGHLVFSTLHTNTAIGAVTRLVDMGLQSYLLSASLIGVLAQRLIRVLCTECRELRPPDGLEAAFLDISTSHEIYQPRGCDACHGTGYRGRTGIYELIKVDDELRQLIHENSSERLLGDASFSEIGTIRDDGRRKVLSGVTTVQEVLRVTLGD